MQKTILITGATDGIGLEAAKTLVSQGHQVLLHGRNPNKLADAQQTLAALANGGSVESYLADLSRLGDVEALAKAVMEKHAKLDVLINNAGVFKTAHSATEHGIDVRFVVNTFAPYRLTQRLLPLMDATGRIINLSSAAQSPVNLKAFTTHIPMSDMEAYAQSKLAITMWSHHMALALGNTAPTVVALNPGSMLATKMVKEAFGVNGSNIGIGADIIVQAALSEEFAHASGQYFDNDSGRFAAPHPDALDEQKTEAVVQAMEAVLAEI